MPSEAYRPLKGPRRPSAQALNNDTFFDYYNRIKELFINMFEWKNLPDSVSERFIELTLCDYGYAVYFNDEIIGNLCLTAMYGGPLDVYRIPIRRTAYAANGYNRQLSNIDSVLIFNNYLHQPSLNTIMLFARRLYELERAIDVNVKAQKTPMIITCEESQELTMKNLYKQYDGNEPVIFGTKNLDLNGIKSIPTAAPFVADKLQMIKREVWAEVLQFVGINSNAYEKKERLVTAEVDSTEMGAQAQRFIMLNARREAAKQINQMFGTNIQVDFRIERSTGGEEDGELYSDAGASDKQGISAESE